MDLATNFEELMQKSPISPHEMKVFLREMRRTNSGTVTVSKLLANKIQSSSEAQAIHAFDFLETALESETEGSIEFRTEIGRYRFLNEIIRVLSPKYLGDKTPEAVKERAIKFLEDASGPKRKRWFPSEHSKVSAVYQSLVDGNIIQKPASIADEDAEFQKSIFERGENAVILKRLLQSKDPSDLQAANRLIKNLVDEEARRNERRAELHSLIDRIETSTGLLTEMLTQPNIDKEIVDELVDTCRSLRQKLGGVATETNDEATSLLQASENIEAVLSFYDSKKEFIGKASVPGSDNVPGSSHNAKEESGGATSNAELSLADQLLMSLGDERINGVIQQSQKQKKKSDSDNLLLSLDIDLSPVPTSHHKSAAESDTSSQQTKPEPVEPFEEISKLSREMMEEGLKGRPIANSSQSKKTDKTPISLIKRTSPDAQTTSQQPLSLLNTNPAVPPVTPQNSLSSDPISLLDLDFLDKPSYSGKTVALSPAPSHNDGNVGKKKGTTVASEKPEKSELIPSSKGNENLLLVLENENSQVDNKNKTNKKGNTGKPKTTEVRKIAHANNPEPKVNGTTESQTPTSEPGFCLNSVKELDLEKIDLLEDIKPVELNLDESCKDVNLAITFGTYPTFPSSVSVAVITLTNRSRSTGLLNYVFQLLPPKGLLVKLLPPGCMELPPWKKTFLPPPILTQVALILLPKPNSVVKTQSQPKIKFILSYCVEDETTLHNGEFSLPSSLLQQ